METLNLFLILAVQTPWNRLDLQHELGPLKAPGAIALGPADSLFVLERYPAHLEIFSRNGTCDQVALAWPEDFVQDPIAMLVRENQVWISEDTTRSLWCFDDQGQFRVQIDFGLWGGSPGHLAQATDGIWVVDRFLKLLLRLDTVSFQIVEAQKIPEMVREPGALCLTPQGPVIVDEMSQSLTNLSTQSGFGAWGDPPGFFDGPTDLVWQDGLWVCDRNNHRLQKFSLEGQLLGCWGSHELWPHQGQGWLHYPDQIVPWLGGWAVLEKLEARIQFVQVSDQPAKGSSNTKPHFGPQLAFHPQGFMAATDPAHARILIYDLQRTIPVLIHQFGSRGEAPHQFNRLSSMTFCGDRLAVWDERFRRITWFGFDFQPEEEVRYNPRLSRFIKSEPLPKGVPDGSILLFGTGPNLVLVNPEHAWVALMEERSKDWIPLTPPGGWLQPSDVEVDPEGTLWVLDSSSKKIQRFSTASQWSSTLESADLNGVVQPFGLAVQDQQFAITDRVNHQIHLFDRQGQQQKAWGGWGQGPRQMIDPLDIGTDSQKRFFLVDNGNHRLVVMDQAGNWQVLFTGGRSITPEMQALIPQ